MKSKNATPSSAAISQANRLYFLDFIRNLPTQSLILAVALAMISKFTNTIDLHNTVPTLFTAALVLIWGYAAYANISLFLERTLENNTKVRAMRLLRHLNSRRRELFWVYTKYLFRSQKTYVMRVYATLGIAEIGFTVSILYAVQSAESLLKVFAH